MIQVADHTLNAIDAAIAADSGASFRGWEGKVFPHIGDAYRTDKDEVRGHMGASQLGADCSREIWYGFRWATVGAFEPRMLRLFNRGHLEEARFIALLLMIGCQVFQQDENGKQFRITFAEGHGGGSGDGIVVGVPDIPAIPCISEFKTHSEKSFIELAGKLDEWRKYRDGKGKFTGKGLREAKPEHYIQMNLYMHKMGYTHGIYMAVCKNTDDIYAEIVEVDHRMAEHYLQRGEALIWAENPPKKMNESPGFWKCRFCGHKPVCHGNATPKQSCRSCKFSRPEVGGNGKWHCYNPVAPQDLTLEEQKAGCSHYERLF